MVDEISPFFALEAEQLLESGFVDDAIELCNLGLEKYPNYAAAISVLSRAYKIIGKEEESNSVIKDASISLSKNGVINQILSNRIVNIKPKIKPQNKTKDDFAESLLTNDSFAQSQEDDLELTDSFSDKDTDDYLLSYNSEEESDSISDFEFEDANEIDVSEDFQNEFEYPTLDEKIPLTFPNKPTVYNQTIFATQNNFLPEVIAPNNDALSTDFFDFRLADVNVNDFNFSFINAENEIIEEPKNLKDNKNVTEQVVEALSKFEFSEEKLDDLISEFDELDAEYEYNSKPPVTETLAKIYEEQEAYLEAIEAYKTLKTMFPEKEKIYSKQIAIIKKAMKNN